VCVSAALKEVRIDLASGREQFIKLSVQSGTQGIKELRVVNLVRHFPSLEPFSLDLVRLATILCGSIARAMLYAAELL
jgi:hypothetical protein